MVHLLFVIHAGLLPEPLTNTKTCECSSSLDKTGIVSEPSDGCLSVLSVLRRPMQED